MKLNKIDALEGALEKLKDLLERTEGAELRAEIIGRIADMEKELDKAYEEVQ